MRLQEDRSADGTACVIGVAGCAEAAPAAAANPHAVMAAIAMRSRVLEMSVMGVFFRWGCRPGPTVAVGWSDEPSCGAPNEVGSGRSVVGGDR